MSRFSGKNILLYTLMGSFFCLIGIVHYQGLVGIVPPVELGGYFVETRKPVLKPDSWFDESYQDAESKYVKQNYGFSGYAFKIYNQLQFDLFKKLSVSGIKRGYDGFLFEQSYLDSYTGHDYIGKDSISAQVSRLEMVVDSLDAYNVKFLLLIAPGKAWYLPEMLPPGIHRENRDSTNYGMLINQLGQSDIPYFDVNGWFINAKDTSTYPLYPKNGVHWSMYGEYLVIDSLLNYLNTELEHSLAIVKVNDVILSDSMRGTDEDIEQSLNLLKDIPDLEMAYPDFEYIIPDPTSNPNILTIADSYYWGIYNTRLSYFVFNNSEFWYYFEERHPPVYNHPNKVELLDLQAALEKNRMVILVTTEANLKEFGFGFIEAYYEFFNHSDRYTEEYKYRRKILQYTEAIYADPKWYGAIEKQAEEQGISLDSAIYKNAQYMIWREN